MHSFRNRLDFGEAVGGKYCDGAFVICLCFRAFGKDTKTYDKKYIADIYRHETYRHSNMTHFSI